MQDLVHIHKCKTFIKTGTKIIHGRTEASRNNAKDKRQDFDMIQQLLGQHSIIATV